MKCAMCESTLEDVVYGLQATDEYWFCSRFCRTMFQSDKKFAEHKEWVKNE